MLEMTPLLVAVMAFGCVTIIIFIVGRYVTSQATMHRRLPIPASTSQSAGLSEMLCQIFFLLHWRASSTRKSLALRVRSALN